ncbi:uncharacterized protein LOC141817744 [Curcuma longa]|uniref:uncharacterized protein LOC141817744 n=1 Tax=Curcuma longa TaxID=136217 RepID=UPI003D9E4046
MEGHLEFRDWEILMGSDAGEDDWKPSQEHDSGDGAIVHDYFALDSREERRKGASFDGNDHDEETVKAAAIADSKNPRWVDPDTGEKDVGFPEASTDSDGCGFDEPEEEEKRSRLGSQKGELGGAKAPEIVEKIHEDEEGEEVVGTMKMGIEKPEEEGCEEHVEIEGIGLQNDLVKGREKKVMAWWKLPFELLKLCAFRVKPVWYISLATAILGLWMLRKKLYKMKHRSRSIPLKIAPEVKKPLQSQLKIQAVRLNEAFSVVRRLSILKSQLPAGGLTSWSVLTLQ